MFKPLGHETLVENIGKGSILFNINGTSRMELS